MYNICRETAVIDEIISSNSDIDIVKLRIGKNIKEKAINYKKLTGDINSGDRVVINTTAVELKLGTGGYHFIINNLDNPGNDRRTVDFKEDDPGHIMKMRYTPYQVKTLCVEEKDSPYHNIINEFTDLAGQIIVMIPLHSLLAPLAVVFKHYYPREKLVYIMTEGGSLPLHFSNLVRDLTERGYIDTTITVGQAFGGDLEAVNIFTGLAAARVVAGGDLIVVGMGPGITGTGTRLGFSGVENAFTSYAVTILKGRGIMVPRVSLAESRARHHILSHHTITLLKELVKDSIDVVFPGNSIVREIIKETGLIKKHNICFYKYDRIKEVKEVLKKSEFEFNSMGRNFNDDPIFFITGGLPVLRYAELLRE